MRRAIQGEWLVPRMWYNIVPDLPKPLPPYLKPSGDPVRPEEFEVLFVKELESFQKTGGYPYQKRGLSHMETHSPREGQET